jgi:hypothetical protein
VRNVLGRYAFSMSVTRRMLMPRSLLGAAELEELAEPLPRVVGGPDDGPPVCHAVPFSGSPVPRYLTLTGQEVAVK